MFGWLAISNLIDPLNAEPGLFCLFEILEVNIARDATAVDPASAASSSGESFATGVFASASLRRWPPEFHDGDPTRPQGPALAGERGEGGRGGGSVAGRLPGPPGPLGGGARSGPPSGRDLQGRGGVLAAAWPWLSGWVVRSLPGGGEGGEGGNEAFTTEIGSLLHVTANTADYDFEPSITTDCKFVQLITTDYYRLLHHYSSIATELLQYYCKLC